MDVSPADISLPHHPRPLKRSASTISLPTPPRTHRRRKRGRSRDSDTDEAEQSENVLLTSDEEGDELPRTTQNVRKKRRLEKNTGGDGDDEAFWMPRPEQKSTDDKHRVNSDAPTANDPSSSAPLLYRKSLQRSQSRGSNGLASPPPSHRKPVPVTPEGASGLPTTALVNVPPTSPPVTPKKKTGLAGRMRMKGARTPEFPIISDSPNNPFYVVPASPSPGEESESPRVSVSPKTPGTSNFHEKPTVTYVFRGVRREYQNPLFDHAKNRPLSPPPNSLLPIEHPDYSPDMTCKPTLLFPNTRKGKRSAKTDASPLGPVRRSPRRKRPMIGDSEDEHDGLSAAENAAEETAIRPRKLNFGPLKSTSKVNNASAGAAVGTDNVF